jgi:hypothetical protein
MAEGGGSQKVASKPEPGCLKMVSSYVAKKQRPGRLGGGLIATIHQTLSGLGSAEPPPATAALVRQCRSAAQCSATVWCVSNSGFAPKPCGAICGCTTGLRSARTAPAGSYRRITRRPHQPIRSDVRRWLNSSGSGASRVWSSHHLPPGVGSAAPPAAE